MVRPKSAWPRPFVADVLADLVGRVAGRERRGGRRLAGWHRAAEFLAMWRDPGPPWPHWEPEGPRHLAALRTRPRDLSPLPEDKVRPHASTCTGTNGDIPEEIISGLAALGGFGLSVPEEFGGFATAGKAITWGMVVAPKKS